VKESTTIGVMLDSFPTLSETFIYYQIMGILKKGYEVQIYPSKQGNIDKVHKIVHQLRLIEKVNHIRINIPPRINALKCFVSLKFWRFWLNNIGTHPKTIILDFPEIEPFIGSQLDLIHIHYLGNASRALKIRKYRIFNGPMICSFHGYDVHDRDFLIGKSFVQEFKSVDLFTSNSDFTRNAAVSLGCPPSKIKYVPEPLDANKYLAKKPAEVETFKIVTVGRLVEFKGIEFGIRSMFELIHNRKIKNIQYHVFGSGPLFSILLNLVDELNLQGNVHLHGSATQEQIVSHLSNSDLFISPGIKSKKGREENQGVVIQEAQAAGLPVICSDVGGVSQGLLHGKTGFLVESKNINELADKIEYCMENAELAEVMGKMGREFVIENFHYTKNADSYNLIYENLLNPTKQ